MPPKRPSTSSWPSSTPRGSPWRTSSPTARPRKPSSSPASTSPRRRTRSWRQPARSSMPSSTSGAAVLRTKTPTPTIVPAWRHGPPCSSIPPARPRPPPLAADPAIHPRAEENLVTDTIRDFKNRRSAVDLLRQLGIAPYHYDDLIQEVGDRYHVTLRDGKPVSKIVLLGEALEAGAPLPRPAETP